MGNNELSKKALSNTEKLIQRYVIEIKSGQNEQTKTDINKLTDEFTITVNALASLMTDIDKEKMLNMLREYEVIKTIKKSIRRIQCNKSLAFM